MKFLCLTLGNLQHHSLVKTIGRIQHLFISFETLGSKLSNELKMSKIAQVVFKWERINENRINQFQRGYPVKCTNFSCITTTKMTHVISCNYERDHYRNGPFYYVRGPGLMWVISVSILYSAHHKYVCIYLPSRP